MEEQKFEDLVIENDNKKNRQKQMMFKAIIFLIFLLVFGIIYKIFSSSSGDVNVAENSEKQVIKEDFEELKSSSDENFDNFNETIEKLKKDGSNSNAALEKKIQDEQNAEFDKLSEKIDNSVDYIANEGKKAVDNTQKVAKEYKDTAKKVISEKKEAVKKVVKEQKSNTSSQKSVFDTIDVKKPSANEVTKSPVASASGTYIQVYASKKLDLKSHEMKKLDKLGLQYKVLTDEKGMSRVIVGPYSNSDKASALKFIRAKVRKDAFYYAK